MVIHAKDPMMVKSSWGCFSLGGAAIDATAPVIPVNRKGLGLER